MIRDLVDIAIDMVREERLDEIGDRAEANAEERLLDLLMPPAAGGRGQRRATREKLRERLRAGKLDERMVEIEVKDRGSDVRNRQQRRHRRDGHQFQGDDAQPCSGSARASATCAWPRRSITWCRKKSRS